MKRAIVIAAALFVSTTPLIAVAQNAAPAKGAAYKAPRLSFGHPSLEGYWTNSSLTTESRPAEYGDRLVLTPQEVAKIEGDASKLAASDDGSIDPNAPPPSVGGDLPPGQTQFSAAGGNVGGYDRGWLDPGNVVMRVGGQPRSSFLLTPNGRVPPRKASAAPAAGRGAPPAAAGGQGRGAGAGLAAQGFSAAFDNPETRGNGERCITSFGRNTPPPMLPNGFYNNNYQINQSRNAVAIMSEMVHDARVIPLVANKAAVKHRTDGVRPWHGESIGYWEGDTLVVVTKNFPRSQAYNGAWENLTVTERFTRSAPDRLRYHYTIDDSTVWDAPFSGEYEFAPLSGIIYEYACHEGNYALEGILAGAREAERLARTGEQPNTPTGRALNAPIGGARSGTQ